MLGAMAGDIIGSRFEGLWPVEEDFELFTAQSRFTDDTVLTCAVAEAMLQNRPFEQTLRGWTRAYPHAGYGGRFLKWAISDDAGPYGSAGNGSAMRVSPVGWLGGSLEEVLHLAEASAAPTHNDPQGLAGARVVAGAVYLARQGARTGSGAEETRDAIRDFVAQTAGYPVDMTLAEARSMGSGVLCVESIPQALVAFLQAENFEDAVRKAVSIGGDTDTVAAITGSVAEAFFKGVPETMETEVRSRLDDRMTAVLDAFRARIAG